MRRIDPDRRPYGALSAYDVLDGDEVIGTVAKYRTTTYRKAGRLIAQTFHPVRWAYAQSGEQPGIRNAYLYTRRDAVEAVLRAR
jgi:hypothetical protein